ncbi:MAG: glucose-1-phosphate adenylyltransferase [Gammaproteobacteria bacterium]|nr:glucose-1-phosphate adenylyltransferase [Gammaproteobacteria bacterium]
MHISTLAMVLAGGMGSRLYPLTRDRVKPAVPFGGIYRLTDFVLSNCLNSNVRRVCMLTQYKSLSLERHIRYGWSFLPHTLEEYIQILSPQQRVDSSWYQGTADAVYQNVYSIDQARPDCVLILAGDHIYKMNYKRMIKAHVEKKAAVTVGMVAVPLEQASAFGVVEVNKKGHIVSFEEKPKRPKAIPGQPGMAYASMGIYVFETHLLKKVLKADNRNPESDHDFGKNILPSLIHKVPVYGYRFVDENRNKLLYWRDVGTIDAYWEASMDLVAVEPVFNLYDRKWPIHTYTEPSPPAKFVFADMKCEERGGRVGLALDSLISSGVILAGGQVIRSVLSPYVRVDEEARVEECILFNGVKVGAGSRLYRTIVDKDVTLPPGTVVGFDHKKDAKRFTVSPGGVVVISRRKKIGE